ncbi:MAG: hypothetical protein ACRDO7_13240 [Nocardioidaceae bacterium]
MSGCDDAASEQGATSPSVAVTESDPQDLRLEPNSGESGQHVRRVQNVGGERAVVDVVSEDDGMIELAAGPDGEPALRFPAFDGSASAPAAMVRVRPAGIDWMSPGKDAFTFGVDVKLDEVSSGSTLDNGDNVVQRGLFDDDAQFKLQLDRRVPSCLIRGDQGTVMVKGPAGLDADGWYRIQCRRQGDAVTIAVARTSADGTEDAETSTSTGSIGRVEFLSDVPMSVGGKITSDGVPAAATDQFNGLLSGVFFSVGR